MASKFEKIKVKKVFVPRPRQLCSCGCGGLALVFVGPPAADPEIAFAGDCFWRSEHGVATALAQAASANEGANEDD